MRHLSRVPGTLAALVTGTTATFMFVFGSAVPASAQPTTVAEAQRALAAIQEKSSAIDSQYAASQEKLQAAQQRLAQVQADAKAVQTKIDDMRSQVSQVALEQWRGNSMSTTMKLITASDPEKFLGQLSTTRQVELNNQAVLDTYKLQVDNLVLTRRAAEATAKEVDAANSQIATLKQQADAEEAAAATLLANLTTAQREEVQRAALAASVAAVSRQAERPAAAPATKTATQTSAPTQRPAATGSASSRARQALAFAMAQIGKPYVYGATGPSAYDCSGLTMAAYASAGVSLPRTSQAQYGVGSPVGLSNLQPGDLVFYYSGITHVGIYAGNGQAVNALNPREGVKLVSVTMMPFMGGRRVA